MYLLFINNRNVNNVNIMIHKQYEFLDIVGLTEDNSLVHLLITYDCENDEEINLLAHSKYYSTNDSILGPLLFLIYINDLDGVSNVLQMLMYADDTTLYCNFNSINNVNRINEELCKVIAWLSANKLALNVAKTKYIMFRTINKRIQYPEVKLNNIAI